MNRFAPGKIVKNVSKIAKVLGTDDRFIPAGDLVEVLTSHAIKRGLKAMD